MYIFSRLVPQHYPRFSGNEEMKKFVPDFYCWTDQPTPRDIFKKLPAISDSEVV